MGEVYRARDPRLGRDVALKVLSAAFEASPDRLARFEREARAVAALSHPNIVVLYSVEEHEGVRLLTMELVDGESLRDQLRGGALPISRVLEIAFALSDALTAAHEKGVVHRDLKPENLMVTKEGRLKVLDFGLAKWMRTETAFEVSEDSTISTAASDVGQLAGTFPYMAPEQLLGQPVDGRADIFALGAVLYELAAGRRAFEGHTMPEVTGAILHREPTRLVELRGDIPLELERAVSRCLEKQPEARPSARELRSELQEIQRSLDRGAHLGARPGASAGHEVPASPSIAVLPFRDLQRRPENSDLGLALADATITELAQMRSLVVRPTSTIVRYQEGAVDAQAAARELGVDAVVEGTFQRSGSRLRVTVQLVSRSDGRPRWGTKIDTSLEDIFRMQDEVSRRIAETLNVQLSPVEDRRLAEAARPAPLGDAYAEYMGGKRHLFRGTLEDVNVAIERFERARSIDPNFAAASAALGDAYMRMAFEYAPGGDWQARAQSMCERALALDPNLPEGRYLRGRLSWNPVTGFDHAGALRDALAALAVRPGLIEARYLVGLVLFHVGLLDESDAEFGVVLGLDPQDLYAGSHRGTIRLFQGRYGEALAFGAESSRRVSAPWVLCLMAQCHLRLGQLEQAAQVVARLEREAPSYSEVHSLAGLVAALIGDRVGARNGIERTLANPQPFGHFHHAQHDLACIHAVLGELDPALEHLTQTARNGFPCQPFFAIDPLLQALQRHPGFAPLMRELDGARAGYQQLYQTLRAEASA